MCFGAYNLSEIQKAVYEENHQNKDGVGTQRKNTKETHLGGVGHYELASYGKEQKARTTNQHGG